MAKLNASADKVDGLMRAAGLVGAPGTKGAVQQVSDAAQSIKKLADDVDMRVKEISVGLNRFRQFRSAPVRGACHPGSACARGHRPDSSFVQTEPELIIWGRDPRCRNIAAGQ